MRTAVESDELLRLLNAELATHPDTADCRFVGPIHRLREPDATGANWSDALSLTCSGRPTEPSAWAARQAVLAVRAQYNLG